MQQRNCIWRKTGLITVLFAAMTIVSCHSSQQLIDPKLSLKNKTTQPEFLNEIALGGNAVKNGMIAKAVASDSKQINPSITNVLQQKYAQLLRTVPNAITNLSLYNFIEDWYGVRYRMGGNDRKGIDCSAFVQRLYENVFCVNLVRTAFEQFHTSRFVSGKDSLQEGDLVFFHTRGRKHISHVGIYLMNQFFVHASSTQGVMISSLDEDYWSRYYAGAGKVLHTESSF